VDFALAGVAVAVIVGLIILLRRNEAELTEQAEKAIPGALEHPSGTWLHPQRCGPVPG
jgi:hypothetical protein